MGQNEHNDKEEYNRRLLLAKTSMKCIRQKSKEITEEMERLWDILDSGENGGLTDAAFEEMAEVVCGVSDGLSKVLERACSNTFARYLAASVEGAEPSDTELATKESLTTDIPVQFQPAKKE